MIKKTHFGFESIDLKDKQSKVNQVFNSVVNRYDLMNDLMSGGLHRVWKHQAIGLLGLKKNEIVLDLATGSGDLSFLAKQIVTKGEVIATDINLKMLKLARNKHLDKGIQCHYVQMDAQKIAFKDESFDAVMVGFGMRNFPEIDQSLIEIYRVLKKSGRLMILEFSKMQSEKLSKAYQFYNFNVLPILGKTIAKDEKAYQYLAESIERHLNQEELKSKLESAGFQSVKYKNLAHGIVAVHLGYKDEKTL